MLSLIRVITAAAIQVHAAFGCCAHDWRDADERALVQNEPLGCEHDCRGDHDVAEITAVDCHGCLCTTHPHACHHANCSWSATEARKAGCHWLQELEHACAHRVGAKLFVLDRDIAAAFASWTTRLIYAPTVRTHLANCVLLI